MKILSLILVCCIIHSAGFAQSQNHFKKSLPEEQGLTSEVFADAIKKLKEDGTNIHSWVVIKNNHLVVDAAFYPFNNKYVHDLASVTKSQMALLIGIAIDQQFIKHENIPILTYFPEFKTTNDTLQKVTIKDLLNMSSGFECGNKPGEKELYDMRNTSNWAAFMLSLPFSSQPHEAFSYCSGNFYLLAEILQRATKMTCHQFAENYLFKPLNFGKTFWPKNDKGVNYGWGDLHLSIYDFAKIGVLILNDGEWNGKQIISKQWIQKMQPVHKAKGTESYGYGWWFDSENPDGIQAMGRGGQRIFIYRKTKIVVATFGGGGYDSGHLDDTVFKALAEYENGKKQNTELQHQIIKASLPDRQSKVNTKLPKKHLNKTFLLEKNEAGIKSIMFKKNKGKYVIFLHFTDNCREKHLLTMDNQFNLTKERTFNLPMAIKGKWADDTLFIEYNRLTRIENLKLAIRFKTNDALEIKMTEVSKGINQSIAGQALVIGI